MTFEQAMHYVRSNANYSDLVRDSYLGEDVRESAMRFANSAEFAEVLDILKGVPKRSTILDLGAGNGIASWSFAQSGFAEIYALEPSGSHEFGRGAIDELCNGLPVRTLNAWAEHIPLPDETIDVIYARQVLHHTADLYAALAECSRVLRTGGILLASREHVCSNREELREFLSGHPIHRLAGGENAFALDSYRAAIESAGLHIVNIFGPWASIINAFPAVRSREELEKYHRIALERRLGYLGTFLSFLPLIKTLTWAKIKRPKPGRLYSFVAIKPGKQP